MSPWQLIALDISPAPAAADNGSVLLWVVSALTAALVWGVLHLSAKIKRNEEICAENEKRHRADMTEMHLKVESLLTGVVRDQALAASRQEGLMVAMQATIERNTEAFGSGKHRTQTT